MVPTPRTAFILLMGLLILLPTTFTHAEAPGRIVVRVKDKATSSAIPFRIHLKDKSGQPIEHPSLPFWYDHFVCSESLEMDLPSGEYQCQIERGPEYTSFTSKISVQSDETTTLDAALTRITNLREEGWWCGELHVHRPYRDMTRLMLAEDLYIAPVITWWNDRNLWNKNPRRRRLTQRFDRGRYYDVMAGEDEREGGALLYFNLKEPLPIAGSGREHPSPMQFLNVAHQHEDVHIDIEKPFWWDVPVWLSSGKIDTIGIANNHMCRSQMYPNEAWGRPRDTKRLPNPRGNGFWTQEIYYHILNCGLRVPPSAGSASGVLPNPVGYNRVYVHAGKSCTYKEWFEGLRQGRSFVTNGPLLRVRANGQLPGHRFKVRNGQEMNIDLDIKLDSRDPIEKVELISNGKVIASKTGNEWAETKSMDSIPVESSGWFLIRVIADVEHTFRFASTAPFYLEVGPQKRRVSRNSARFFLDWIDERMARINIRDQNKMQDVLKYHDAAKMFWKKVMARANAE